MPDHTDKKNLTLDDGSMSGLGRWIPTIIVVCVVAGFFALSWYAYHAGMQSVQEEDLLVVEAEESPLKEKPEDPGGMQFPNQDKTIFETFNKDSKPPERVERILPGPEEPMSKDVAAGDTKTWINKDIKNEKDEGAEKLIGVAQAKNDAMNNSQEQGGDGVMAEDKKFASETYVKEEAESHARAIEIQKQRELEIVRQKREAEQAAELKAKQEAEELAKSEEFRKKAAALAETERKAAEEKAAAQAEAERKLADQKAAEQKAADMKAEAEKAAAEEKRKQLEAAASFAAPVKTSNVAGNETVQLGAFRSEDEASQAWNTMHIKHKVLSDKRPKIVRADLGAKGIYFRLRIPEVNDAKALCATLSAAGQACLPVKGE